MKRREFIVLLGAAVTWPQSLIAQVKKKRQLIGVLANEAWPPLDALRKELRELGYIGGQNFNIIYRFAEGQADRYPALAAELVHVPVDVIVTWGTPASLAAKDATNEIPIIMTSGTLSPWASFRVFHIRAAMLQDFLRKLRIWKENA
jgi:putative ABC transport system substrate-binding protein